MTRKEATNTSTAPKAVEDKQRKTQSAPSPSLDEMINEAKGRTPVCSSTAGGPGSKGLARSKVCH